MKEKATPKLWIINSETGEIVADKILFFGKKPWAVDRNFVKVWVAALVDILMDEELNASRGPLRLLLYFISKCDYNKLTFGISWQEACNELKINKMSYYRWLKVLEKKELVTRVAHNIYELRPLIAIKGSMTKAVKIPPRIMAECKNQIQTHTKTKKRVKVVRDDSGEPVSVNIL